MKTVIFKSIALMASLTIFCQCQTKQKGSHAKIVEVNGHKVIDCNIGEVTDTLDLQLSDLVKKCEMIPLETNESSLFESVYHIGISDNYIAIHSRGQMPIKLFDRKGKFIRNIGSIGKGPGEFSSLYGMQLDEPNNRVYLTPFANAKELIVYSLDNRNLPAIPLVYKQTKCQAYVENDVVTVLSMPFKLGDIEPIPVAYQQTTAGKLLKELKAPDQLLINPKNAEGQFVGFNSEISSNHNAGAHDLYIMSYGSETPDTLYHYNTEQNTLIPKYFASFSGEKQASWSHEWRSHYWTIVYGKKYKGAKVIVDKKTLKSDFFKLKNDFYGGIEMKKIYLSNNGMFVAGISPLELLAEFDKALKNDELSSKDRAKIESLKKSLNENDNEVLFVGEMF